MLVAFRYGDKRIFSRFISWWQRHDASHCEIALERVGDAYRCASSSWLDGGVRTAVIDLDPTKWRVYDVDRDQLVAASWLRDHVGDGYDWLGLLGFVVRPIKGWMRLWWCSEACAEMMGLHDSWRFDVAVLENFCADTGKRVL